MNEKTTPQNITSEKTSVKHSGPSQFTLAFIRQFARAYVFEPQLPQKVAGYIAN